MSTDALSLRVVYDGWDGYQTSLVHTIEPLTREQLAWRPATEWRSIGEVAGHIAFGRVDWFRRMGAPGSAALAEEIAALRQGRDVGPETLIADDAAAIVRWLEATWRMVEATLAQWTTADLAVTYPHTYWGKTYAVSRQWTIWRILTHDVQHGGQLTVMLAMQGIEPPELASLGGHLAEPPLVQGT